MWIGFWLLVRSENQMLSAWVMVRPADERATSPTLKSSRNGPSVMARMLAATARRSRHRDCGRLGPRAESHGQSPNTRVDLGVAIRAKHHAAFELLSDFLPRSID